MAMITDVSVRPFHFWSQKVIPLVYDESLSYYEVLGKVVEKLNELIEYVDDYTIDLIKEVVDELFVEALYDAETETITLTTEIGGN